MTTPVIDQIEASAKTTGHQPFVVMWRVTERCNLSCPFCAYDRTRQISRHHADSRLIQQFGAILASLERPVLVSWLGGEPLLWPALTPLTELFHRRHGFAISTTTNGTTADSIP